MPATVLSGSRARLLASLLVLPATSASAQQFEEALSVRQGGKEIGREEYTLHRMGEGRLLLMARAQYPPANPTLRIGATLQRTPESIGKFELDVQGPEGNLVILAAGSGTRLVVRSVAPGSEAGRELPGGRDVVLLDDRVLSLYVQVADLASPAGTRLTAVIPRARRRASFTARREPGDAGETRIQLSGEIAGTLVLDSGGRIVRLDLPSAGIAAIRAGK